MNKISASKLYDKIGNFVTIPESVIEMWPKIGLDALALFVYLRYRTNQKSQVAFPSYTTITKDTTLRRERIAGAIRMLEKHSLLERQKRFGASTVYTIKLPPSSPGGGLLGDLSVIRGADSSSPPVGLSVVRQADTNQIDLNKIEINQNNPNAAQPRGARERDLRSAHSAAFEALADITGLTPPERDWKQLPRTAAGQLNRYAKELRDVRATPELILGFLPWFKKNDWRGKEGRFPAPADVVKLWPMYLTHGGRNNGKIENLDAAERERLQRLADEINAARAAKRRDAAK